MPFSTAKPAPTFPKRDHKTVQHGIERNDPYHWLKDENWRAVMSDPSTLNSDIRGVLEAQNTYTQSIMSSTAALQETLFEEMKGRIKDDDSSVPSPDGPYEYFDQYRPGDQHGLYLRRPRGDERAQPTILIDADALAKGKAFFDLGTVAHSPDHHWLAYSVDNSGAEQYRLYFKRIETGEVLDISVPHTTGAIEWASDSRTAYWVERDDNQRPCKVYRQTLIGDNPDAAPELVYEESDPGFFVSIGRSDASNFIEISTHNHTTSEVWLLDAHDPKARKHLVAARREGIEYDLHEQGDDFYILTNQDGATDFKIMRAPKASPQPEHWEDYAAHTPGTLILGLETYARHLVWLERSNALPRIVIVDMNTQTRHTIEFDEQAYSLGLMGGYEYDTNILRFAYSSPTTPGQVFDYNMATRERTLRKTREVPSGHNRADYAARRISITARDGADIPVTLIHRAGQVMDGSAPILLYGYGSYGITIPASFRTSILSLVDRGFVYAIAHIRGGMAKGYQWYLDGKLEKKVNTFNDYVDAGEALCAQGFGARGRVIAHGGSAGGLLVGAAVNQAPDLFGGVIGAVPFVDVLSTMSDDSLPLTPPEWPEWGNPIESAQDYARLAAYSPYDNVTAQNYPPMLITGGLTDPRVTYWEPAKWAAKLRDHQTGDAPILLKINMDAGHQGESGRYNALKETAFEYAFAMKAAGVEG